MQSKIITPQLFPKDGKTRAKQNATFLGIGVSTFWLYVKQGRINQPMRYGQRVSVWDAEYIRQLAKEGIPELTRIK
jgi:predicted DNA-binding transcriptional regulator AlpA